MLGFGQTLYNWLSDGDRWATWLTLLSHPIVLEVVWISYYSRWHPGWIITSLALLVGLGGFFHYQLHRYPEQWDILALLKSPRRFLLLWHTFVIFLLWGAATPILLHLWLGFFLWMSLSALILHWFTEYSFHTYGWGGLTGFFSWYLFTYPFTTMLWLVGTLGVAYLRYTTRSHLLREVVLGAAAGLGSAWLYQLAQSLT
ncbi:MAG: hypothetical protein NZ958_05695 [Bacteroidia bacterium]|nr:hypothetical protein [Bacteroidia bacterium]MDW8088885.1 hypothetical protein [Bacteroidia bacterium]